MREIARALSRGGDEVRVLVPHTEELADEWGDLDGVRVRSFRYAPKGFEVLGYGRSLQADERPRVLAAAVTPPYLRGARQGVLRELEEWRPEVVQAHWIVPNAVALTVPGRWPKNAPPLTVGLHGSDVFMAEKPGVRWLARRALRDTQVLTGCSPELVERVAALGFEGHREVIPYGIDPGQFRPGVDESGWRKRLGIPEDAVLFLGVGRMATKKGFQVLVPELASFLERFPTAWVVLAGGGDREAEFKAACEGLRVCFPGAVERDVLPDLYRAADVFVLPAVHDRKGNVDGLPNVILEALASALPVIASGISGIPLAVETGHNGYLTREGDGAEVVDRMAALAEDAQLRRQLGEAGRARVVEQLTWDQVAARYRHAYERALELNARS
ncbi:MAG: glycosyltransferase [Acidobacteriota bacterium]